METTNQNREIHKSRTRLSRVSWGAIFGGTLIMLITLMLLSLLGIGIGIASIDPMEESQPMQGLGTGALIWWVVSNLIAVFAGAFMAAKLTGLPYSFAGMTHGILTWSLYALISFILMTSSIGGIISGVGGAISKTLSAVEIGLPEISSLADEVDVDTDRINRLIQDALAKDRALGGDTTEGKQFDIDIMAIAGEVFTEDGEINTDVDREELVQSVSRNSTLSQQDAERAADVISEEYKKVEMKVQDLAEQAEEKGQDVSDALGKAAIWSFVALLFGVLTAALGGHLGKPNTASLGSARTIRREDETFN